MIAARAIEAGLERAGQALQKWVRRPVESHATHAEEVEPSRLLEYLGGPELEIIGVLVGINGGTGDMLFTLDPESADALAQELSGEDLNAPMGESSLKETVNIMASAYLSGVSEALGRKLLPESPLYCRDMAGAVIEEMLAAYPGVAARVAVIDTHFGTGAGSREPSALRGRVLLFAERQDQEI